MDMAGTVMDMAEITDKRMKPPYPVTAHPKDKIKFVGREEAAGLASVTVRTITRWARDGYLTKFTDSRGRVRFSEHQVKAMNSFQAGDESG